MIDDGKSTISCCRSGRLSPSTPTCTNYTQIFAHQLRKIEHFFATYKLLEGKKYEHARLSDAGEARRIIMEAADAFDENKL